MGFYLPGIGEAIGGALRGKHQADLWEQAQGVLKDETKPMADRLQLVSSMYPELASSPEFKNRMDTARQYDADKMARARFDREEAERKSVDTFKGVLAELDPEARVRVMRDNPDKAAVAFPEEWGLIKDTDKAAADREEVLMLENGRNARSAASINARREATQATLAATAAKPVPETPEQKQAREVETARLKALGAQEVKAEAATQRYDEVTSRQTQLLDELAALRESSAFSGPAKAAKIVEKENELVEAEAALRTPPGVEINAGLREEIRAQMGFPPLDATRVGMTTPAWLGGNSRLEASRAAINERRVARGLPPLPPPGAVEDK